MSPHISPYHVPGMYEEAISKGRHRDIIGGRWDETGLIQMGLLTAQGLQPRHRLLDIGCGPLRTGSRLVPFLNPRNYWGTDLSGELMRKGWRDELTESDRSRLPKSQLIEDKDFSFKGVPTEFDYLFCFAVFTHLPMNHLRRALISVNSHFTSFEKFVFTVFLAPNPQELGKPFRQPDGVVTHEARAPYHILAEDVHHFAAQAGLKVQILPARLPRGQVACIATRA